MDRLQPPAGRAGRPRLVLGRGHRRPRTERVGEAWAQRDSADQPLFRTELLADPRCAVLACRRDDNLIAGVITYAAGQVTGISNLFGAGLPDGQLWPSVLHAVAARRPDLPIVGYEHGTDLACARQAGCQALGPLRVWAHDPGP